MNREKENAWLQEYEDFLKTAETEVPYELKNHIFSKIKNLLHPSPATVFLKILGIHMGIGFLSLSVCHQFGINPFHTEKSLADWMMQLGGHYFCMLGCGILFVSLSVFAAGYFLTVEEINALKRTEFFQTLALGLISLGLFAMFGAELALGFAGLWLVGGFMGGLIATETVWRLKRV